MIDSSHAMPMSAKLIDGVSLARFFGASPVAMLIIDAGGCFPSLGNGSIAGEMETWRDITEVQCIPSQIKQMVGNLVVNAANPIGPERGQGTTMHVTLPIHPPATQASDGASPP